MGREQNQSKFELFRQQFPVFAFDNYEIHCIGSSLEMTFHFSAGSNIHFEIKPLIQTLLSPDNLLHHFEGNKDLFNNLAFHIGLIEAISYWKATCAPLFLVHTGALANDQIKWWKRLYYNGLGEFFYLNGIETCQKDFMQIQCTGTPFKHQNRLQFEDSYLVPIGGGKDSAVTLSLLKQNGKKISPLIINPRGATLNTVNAARIAENEIIRIKRPIDAKLLELNTKGYLNGHTPFSAMLAFYTLMASAIHQTRHIALSNESSANESTIPGTGINHQYSKSLDFETGFRNYYQTYLDPGFNYFSFLRPLNELQIASIFSKLEEYHSVFRSRNAGSKTDSWCGKCAKCLFTYIMIGAFRGIEYADKVVAPEMLNDAEMTNYFDELTGIADIKPFECVGTVSEVNEALAMINEKIQKPSKPLLIKRFMEYKMQGIQSGILKHISEEHHLQNDHLQILAEALI